MTISFTGSFSYAGNWQLSLVVSLIEMAFYLWLFIYLGSDVDLTKTVVQEYE